MNPPWVIFDVSWLGHRAKHTLKDLSFDELPTGVLFGVFENIRSVCADPRICSNKVLLCYDSNYSLRREEYPEYKLKRGEDRTPEEWAEIKVMKHQLKLLRTQIFPDIGFNVAKQAGLESDDVMAQAALQVRDLSINLEAVLVTADGDLYQCITQNTVHWYDPQRDLFLDHMRFWAKKGVEPADWARVKCLAGCDGDNVKGIPGVGEKRAIDVVLNQAQTSHKWYQAILSPEGKAIARRNKLLVKLPHPATRPVNLDPPVYRPDAFFKWARKLGFDSYLDGGRRRAWEQFFNGNLRDRQTTRRRGESR